MHKLKIACLILLAILLTAVGGLLPVAATRMQDKTTANEVRYEDIEALRLRLEEEVQGTTFREKIFLIMHGGAAEINDENTRIKEKEIIEAVNGALTPYMELFFGKSLDNDYFHYYPVMAYDESNPSRYFYYWYVTMSLDASSKDYISLILDDETGKLLAVDVTDPEMNIDEPYLQELQYALSALYLGDLDIAPGAQWPLSLENAQIYDAKGISVAAANYLLADTVYGEVNIEIGVRTDGFYICFA